MLLLLFVTWKPMYEITTFIDGNVFIKHTENKNLTVLEIFILAYNE